MIGGTIQMTIDGIKKTAKRQIMQTPSNIKEYNVWVDLAMTVWLVGMFLITGLAKEYMYFFRLDFPTILFFLLGLLVTYFSFSIIHELIHKTVAKAFGISSYITVKRTEFRSGQLFSKRAFLIIVISPFLFLSLMLIVPFFIDLGTYMNLLLKGVLILKISMCGADLTMFFQVIMKYKKESKLIYTENRNFKISTGDKALDADSLIG